MHSDPAALALSSSPRAAREALIICLPAIIKAHEDPNGRRLIECEASNITPDSEGDVIDQAALLGSAKNFLLNGHLDIDHLSEIGHRIGIPNPESYIIGRPVEVTDLGEGRTGVIGEIKRSADGTIDPIANRYDALWSALNDPPGIPYRASIYGFPVSDAVEDCRGRVCPSGATRFHIHAMEWKSLALTQRPVNTAITGCVKVITAKAFIESYQQLRKSPGDLFPPDLLQAAGPNHATVAAGDIPPSFQPPSPAMPEAPALPVPKSLTDAVGQYHTHIKRECPHTEGMNSTVGFRNHFQLCCNADLDTAVLMAHALMNFLRLEKFRT